MSQQWRWDVLTEIQSQYIAHLGKWSNSSHLDPVQKEFLLWYDQRMLVTVKFNMIECAPLPELALFDTADAIAEFVRRTVVLAENRALLYLQDTSAAHLSTLGDVMRNVSCKVEPLMKIFPRLSPDRKRTLISLIDQIIKACESSSIGQSCPTAFVLRYYRRLAGDLAGVLTRPGSPIPEYDPADLVSDLREATLNIGCTLRAIPRGGYNI